MRALPNAASTGFTYNKPIKTFAVSYHPLHVSTHPHSLHHPGSPLALRPRSDVQHRQQKPRCFVIVSFHSRTQTATEALALVRRAYMNKNHTLTQSEYCSATAIKTHCLLKCDMTHTQGMIWMLNTLWFMHEPQAGHINWKWDYNARATAKNYAVRSIVMQTEQTLCTWLPYMWL